MSEYAITTPVVLIIFNRPHTTTKVFEAIRRAKPAKLFIIADGARLNHPQDLEKCQQTRKIVEQVDWQCEVVKFYADTNLGCGKCVSQGISKVFEQVEQAIILEDDCLSDFSFFRFCQELLIEYQDDTRIMMISGSNPLQTWQKKEQSYHFSYCGTNWGWASWRRAWNFYDYDLQKWQQPENFSKLKQVIPNQEQSAYYYQIWQQAFHKKVDTWDYQWTLACLLAGGISIIPAVNLIKNIGLGKEATHTTGLSLFDASLELNELQFPLQKPQNIIVDQEYDRKYWQMRLGKPDLETINFFVQKLLAARKRIQALLLLQQAIKIYPQNVQLIFTQALTLSQLGQTRRAIAILEDLLSLMPKYQPAQELLNKLSNFHNLPSKYS